MENCYRLTSALNFRHSKNRFIIESELRCFVRVGAARHELETVAHVEYVLVDLLPAEARRALGRSPHGRCDLAFVLLKKFFDLD
jgi:hypothetical protein